MAAHPDSVPPDLLEGLQGPDRERMQALLAGLLADGLEPDELRRAADEGRLPLLAIERVLDGGPPCLSANEIATEVGVPREVLDAQWKALGMVVGDPDERNRNEADLEAARRVKQLLDTGVSPRALEESARVMAMSLAQVAASNRAMVTEAVLADAGGEPAPGDELVAQLDAAERLEAVTRKLIPLVGPTLDHMYKLQVREQLRHAVAGAATGDRPPGVDDVAVAFADLVGFTKLGEELPPEEFGEITQKFAGLAADAAESPVRLVKIIGDAAMFASPDPVALADTVLELLDLVAEQEDDFPGARAGMSWGAAVTRAGDFYGRPVNLASRLTGVARPGSLLAAAESMESLERAFKLSDAGHKRLKGIDGAVHMYRVRDREEEDEAARDGGAEEGEPDAEGRKKEVSSGRRGSRRRRARRNGRLRP